MKVIAASFDVGQGIGIARDQRARRFTQANRQMQPRGRERGYIVNVYVVKTCLRPAKLSQWGFGMPVDRCSLALVSFNVESQKTLGHYPQRNSHTEVDKVVQRKKC